jgi:lipopolysaccharide transport system permease protein
MMGFNLIPAFKSSRTKKMQIVYVYDLLLELVRRDMKLRYKRSVLGLLWSLANPIAQMIVLSFIFQVVFRVEVENYPLFLFIGILVWNWFQAALFSATGSIVYNYQLISRPGFPVGVLPIVTVISHLIHFVLALPIILIFVMVTGIPLTIALIALPVVMLVQFVLTLSLAYLLSAIYVTFRDTQYLLEIVLLFGFYLSPIFYSPTLIPEQYVAYYRLNPMAHILMAYRNIFIDGVFPPSIPLAIVACFSLIMLFLGYGIFRSASYKFVEEA